MVLLMIMHGGEMRGLWINLKEGGPIYPRGKLAAYCKNLEGTNRAWAIPELKKKAPE